MNVKDTDEGRQGFIAANNLTYRMLLDTEFAASQAYNVRALPTVVLIDKAGTIRYQGFSLPDRATIDAAL